VKLEVPTRKGRWPGKIGGKRLNTANRERPEWERDQGGSTPSLRHERVEKAGAKTESN